MTNENDHNETTPIASPAEQTITNDKNSPSINSKMEPAKTKSSRPNLPKVDSKLITKTVAGYDKPGARLRGI